MKSLIRSSVLSILALQCAPCLAYVGPGLGLGALISVLGMVLALLLLVAGALWYPVRKLFRRLSRSRAHGNPEEPQ